MNITFRRTGGFAPMAIGCQLDTDSLAPAEATELQRLVDSSGVLHMHSHVNKAVRDAHTFHLEIERAGQTQQLTLDQTSVPEQLRPLIAFLTERSKSLLPEEE